MQEQRGGTSQWLPPVAAGCATGLLVFLALGNQIVPNADEGIYLQSGVNVLNGAVPYKDFFAITGPGSFWLLAAIFRIAGVTLRNGRLLLALDLAALVSLAYWLTCRLSRPAIALVTSLLCGLLFFSSPGNLVVNHRWDSSAAMLAATALTIAAIQSARRTPAFLAGVFSAAAAWITPPTALAAIVIALRLWFDPKTRRAAVFHAGGIVTGILVPAAILAIQGGFVPMVTALSWNASHYSSANRVAYGSIFGGPAALFAGAHGGEWIVRILLATAFLLPALLPPLVTVAWLSAIRSPRRPEVFLLAMGAAAVFSSYPRWDLLHLLYISPVFVVLAALWLQDIRYPLVAQAGLIMILIPAAIMCAHTLAGEGPDVTIDSPVGRVRVSEAHAAAIRMSLGNVRPSDTLFVFPYEPLFYFLTQARNPTQYLWLQPGMMGEHEEHTALSELMANRPQWVIYRDIAPAAYLRLWPGSDPAHLRMKGIEDFIQANYTPYATSPSPDGPRQLLRRRDLF